MKKLKILLKYWWEDNEEGLKFFLMVLISFVVAAGITISIVKVGESYGAGYSIVVGSLECIMVYLVISFLLAYDTNKKKIKSDYKVIAETEKKEKAKKGALSVVDIQDAEGRLSFADEILKRRVK